MRDLTRQGGWEVPRFCGGDLTGCGVEFLLGCWSSCLTQRPFGHQDLTGGAPHPEFLCEAETRSVVPRRAAELQSCPLQSCSFHNALYTVICSCQFHAVLPPVCNFGWKWGRFGQTETKKQQRTRHQKPEA